MKPHEFAIIYAAGLMTGLGLPFILSDLPSSNYNAEIMRNEQRCDPERRPGYAVYTVTRYGELRGCLRVQQDYVNGIRPAPILIVKKPDVM